MRVYTPPSPLFLPAERPLHVALKVQKLLQAARESGLRLCQVSE